MFFYLVDNVKVCIEVEVVVINVDVELFLIKGDYSKFVILDGKGGTFRGLFEFEWGEYLFIGIVCDLLSLVFKIFCDVI